MNVPNEDSPAGPSEAPPQYDPSTAPPEAVLSDEKMKASIPQEELPINVLIIGETQNGKSTMIKQLGRYAGVPEIDVNIGMGMFSQFRVLFYA
jgi:predicted GTPase